MKSDTAWQIKSGLLQFIAASVVPYSSNPLSRKIIHCDCDCFHAVEMRDDPSLRELPVAVGGRSALATSPAMKKYRIASRQILAVCRGHTEHLPHER